MISAFSLSLGLFMLLVGTVAAWIFKTTNAPFPTKLIVPLGFAMMAIIAPPMAIDLMGHPFYVPFASLPKQAELIAFVPHDEDKSVDLLLRQGSKTPRLYEVTLDDAMKKTLREAGKKLALGERVGLTKRKGPKRPPGVADIETPEAPYQLDSDVFSLPSKAQ